MKNVLRQTGLSFAIACLTAGTLAAQEPRPYPPKDPQAPAATAPQRDTDRDKMVTAQGCLKQEKDVAGAKPNVAERAGIGEDFILTKAKLSKGMAKGSMFRITGLDDEKLRAHANQQVEVSGRLDDKTLTGAQKPTRPGPDTAPDEVAQIEATSIKMIAATCTGGTE